MLARARIILDDESGALSALDGLQALIMQTNGRYFQPFVREQRAAYAQAFGGKWSADEELRTAHRLWTEMGFTAHVERVAKGLD